MSHRIFGKNDILYNRIEANPHYEFVLYTGSVYLNNFSGSFNNIPNGYVSLTEANINRSALQHTYDSSDGTGQKALIYPFITKDGSLDGFGTTSKTSFAFSQYGDEITGSYLAQTASLTRYFVATGSLAANRTRITALRTTFEQYTFTSNKYDYSNYENAELSLICIPSIFFGSAIQKRTVKLRYYVTGTLVAELHDKDGNGELIQVTGSDTGSCEGIVLYKEGFIVLTGSTSVTATTTPQDNFNVCGTYVPAVAPADPDSDTTFKWIYWGEMGLTGSNPMGACATSNLGSIISSSYSLEFKGTTKVSVLTMFAHAPKGELNFSSNPTFIAKKEYPNPRVPVSPPVRSVTKVEFNSDDKSAYAGGTSPKYVAIYWGTKPHLFWFQDNDNSTDAKPANETLPQDSIIGVNLVSSTIDTAAEYATAFATAATGYVNGDRFTANAVGSVAYITSSKTLEKSPPTAVGIGPPIAVSTVYGAGGSTYFLEKKTLLSANTISSSYTHHSASLQKQTFISYIKIYDEHHDCIAVAKLARPLKKLEDRGYTFKLKLDI